MIYHHLSIDWWWFCLLILGYSQGFLFDSFDIDRRDTFRPTNLAFLIAFLLLLIGASPGSQALQTMFWDVQQFSSNKKLYFISAVSEAWTSLARTGSCQLHQLSSNLPATKVRRENDSTCSKCFIDWSITKLLLHVPLVDHSWLTSVDVSDLYNLGNETKETKLGMDILDISQHSDST